MASAMTPILSQYWDQGGKAVRERIGLDPDQWQVTDPNLKAKIEQASLAFCQATNQTTSLKLDAALAKLRAELVAGLVDGGDSIPQLTKRVQSVFDQATKSRARMIAASEAARAVHAAQEQSAIDSGVVVGMEWLVSGDACPLCLQIAAEVRMVPLGTRFAEVGNNPSYKDVRHPPAHPHCQCAMVEVLRPEFGGPAQPQWGTPLIQPDPPEDYKPPGGKLPVPEPARLDPARTEPPAGGGQARPGREAEWARLDREEAEARAIADPLDRHTRLIAVARGRQRLEIDEIIPDQILDLVGREEAEARAELEAIEAKIRDLKAHKDQLSARDPAFALAIQELVALEQTIGPARSRLDRAVGRGERWLATRGLHPDRIPPGSIADRVARYRVGEAKVQAIRELAAGPEAEAARLDAEARRLDIEADRAGKTIGIDVDDLTAETFDRLEADRKRIAAQAREARSEAARIRLQARKDVLAILKVDDPAEVRIDAGRHVAEQGTSSEYRLGDLSPKVAGAKDRAVSWTRRVLARGDGDAIAVRAGQIPAAMEQRSCYYDREKLIAASAHCEARTFVHELGHAFDATTRAGGESVLDRSIEFLEYRTAGRPDVLLSDVTGIPYGPGEKTRDGGFQEHFGADGWYMSKSYRNRKKGGAIDGSELISMAIERLYAEPGAMVADPEYLKFVLGVMDGSLR
jgi:hypothetical protein